MDSKYFLSDNPKTLAKAVQQVVLSDKTSDYKAKMEQGLDYYAYKHDILNYRLFYMDNEGNVKEETTRSNIKIPHGYFTELVDQKTQYLLSNPVEFIVEDTEFQKHLDDYLDEDFQLVLQEVVEGASQKGFEFVYYQKTDEKILFKVADSRKVIEIFDDNFKRIGVVRYYDTPIDNLENLLDVNTFCGALRYGLSKFMAKFPNIKILIYTPTYRIWFNDDKTFKEDSDTKDYAGTGTLPEYVDKEIEVAKEFKVPYLDSYRNMGVNKYNYSIAFTFPDGVHHDGNGRKLFGEIIAKKY